DIEWREPAPQGKLDLVVDLNFRMDTSALYSDIILPSATWYEKNDLNTTDLHSFIHPMSAAVPPCWQSRDDWDIFAAIAREVGELARTHFPEPFRDIVSTALAHDTPDEISQPAVRNWHRGQCEPVPGQTMPNITVVERDYANIHDRFVSYGREHKKNGMAEHGIRWEVADLYDRYLENAPSRQFGGERYIAMEEMKQAANVLLYFAPETNGEVAWRGFEAEEEHAGVGLKDLARDGRSLRYNFDDLLAQPRRLLTSPFWSGITNNGRAYSAYCINVERLLPWRTLTGRQHFYLDHEGYLDFGENLPTFKPGLSAAGYRDFEKSRHEGGPVKTIALAYLTPHGKWHIHSTYYDNLIMLTLSRGVEPFWMNPEDAALVGVRDNDWVEVFNDNGVVVTRAAVSARIPKGAGFFYHAPERTIDFARSPLRKMGRGGGTNALTRIRLKPVFMVGGYAHLSFAFNAWGPPSPDRDGFAFVRRLPGRPVF
nr:molybdopterin-dependent oxidoreductase [Nitrospiraceae bacterium]